MPFRPVSLILHVSVSVGWFGAVLAYVAVAVVASTGGTPEAVRGAWTAMDVIGWWVLVPLSVATLVTGIAGTLGTGWGLGTHVWVRAKLALTVVATAVLVAHMPSVSVQARGIPPATAGHHGGPWSEILHATGGLAVLGAATAISFMKPWGKTGTG